MRGPTTVSSSDHATPFKRPHSTISDSSTSSSSSRSSSILGSLGLLVSSSPAHSPWSSDIRACIEEDEPETGTQAAVLQKHVEKEGKGRMDLGVTQKTSGKTKAAAAVTANGGAGCESQTGLLSGSVTA
ncbi:hypothetical protein H8959_013829 [Pygathrix nigripes]